MSIEDEDHTQAHGDIVDHAGPKTISDFFHACEGRVKPVILRDEMVQAGLATEAAFNALPAIYQLGIQHSDRWLEEFDGHDHTVQCIACGDFINCAASEHHHEIGAMVCIFKADLDLSVGALVFAVCHNCEEQTDDELYAKLVKGLGGDESDIVDKEYKPPAEHFPIVMAMAEEHTAAWIEYSKAGDLEKYLMRGRDAIGKALLAAVALREAKPETPAEAPAEKPTVSQEDVKLLVGD